MYAVIKTGGKQYKVEAGATLKVEKLLGEVGSKVVIDKVLMIADGDNTTRRNDRAGPSQACEVEDRGD